VSVALDLGQQWQHRPFGQVRTVVALTPTEVILNGPLGADFARQTPHEDNWHGSYWARDEFMAKFDLYSHGATR
jgi:hypothetical protein